MQDRYVADAGDYAKYALLKALSGGNVPLSLGIFWYRYPDESHNGDGRHIAYLQQSAFAARDPDIYAVLGLLVASGRRSIKEVEQSPILPAGTLYFSKAVAISGTPAERAAHRFAWFQEGLDQLGSADILFFDPDNGLETRALDKRSPKAGKYVFWSEIEAAWAAGKSLIVYNHLNRSAPAVVQTALLADQFKSRLPGVGLIMPLLFRRGSCRHMWVVAQPRHQDMLETRTLQFMKRGWSVDAEIEIIRSTAGDQATDLAR